MTTARTVKDCDCGFIDSKDPTQSTFDSLLVFDFTRATAAQLANVFIVASYNVTSTSYIRAYTTNNVKLTSAGLQLTCSASTDGVTVPSGGLFTRAQTFFYGSYRAHYLVGTVPGTVAGFFYYKNDTSEIDVEYLSAKTPATLQYSVKPQQYLANGAASNTTYQTGLINDTSVSSDWSFVWKPDSVNYARNSNYSKSITTNVPQAPGRIFLNHWSDGSPNFSQGPPTQNTTITVGFLQAVYNDTSAAPLACVKTKSACLVTDGVITGNFTSDTVGQCCILVVLLWLFWSRSQ